jgi:hypothetical protein
MTVLAGSSSGTGLGFRAVTEEFAGWLRQFFAATRIDGPSTALNQHRTCVHLHTSIEPFPAGRFVLLVTITGHAVLAGSRQHNIKSHRQGRLCPNRMIRRACDVNQPSETRSNNIR